MSGREDTNRDSFHCSFYSRVPLERYRAEKQWTDELNGNAKKEGMREKVTVVCLSSFTGSTIKISLIGKGTTIRKIVKEEDH